MVETIKWLDELRGFAQSADMLAEKSDYSSTSGRRSTGRQVGGAFVPVTIQQDTHGVFRFGDNDIGTQRRRNARRRNMRGAAQSRTEDYINLKHLEPSAVHEALLKLDAKLTPEASSHYGIGSTASSVNKSGLRVISEQGNLVPINTPISEGRILLLLHGTFSTGDTIANELFFDDNNHSAAAFFNAAKNHYDQIITFDHRTLSTTPIINATELSLILNRSKADIDIIAHSRGGLVARWWSEAFDRIVERKGKVVLVGAPLGGTSLASPANLRNTMNMLLNVSRALSATAAFVPFGAVALMLMQVLSSVTAFTARTPVIDAAIALVPGLDAMSRVGSNRELSTLQRYWKNSSGIEYFTVSSDFDPTLDRWGFLKSFKASMDRVKNVGADAVFNGAHDLVVDYTSMTQFHYDKRKTTPKSKRLDFGSNPSVHHTNYFSRPETTEFLATNLIKL